MKTPILKPLLLSTLLALPAVAQAQLTYANNGNGTATITGYTGSPTVVNIPSSTNGLQVTSIKSRAFNGCSSLTSVTIPNSVTNIGIYAFHICTSLTAINVDTNNPANSSVGGALFSKDQTTLIEFPGGKAGNYTIPDGVTNIGIGAFSSCLGLTSVTIPNSVISIGSYVFSYCSNLTGVTIFNSVTSIGIYAFENCTSLTNATIGSGVTNFAQGVFADCSGLTGVTIPNGVQSIGTDAFAYCTNLTSVTIPNSVTSIGSGAFFACISLTNATIGSGVTNIANGAFKYCQTLTGVYFLGNAPGAGSDTTVFSFDNINYDHTTTIYYLSGTTGWHSPFDGIPAVLFNPPPPASTNNLNNTITQAGVRTNRFGFNLNGSSNQVYVVEASTNMVNWLPVATNMLNTIVGTNGTSYFSDPQWTNYPGRFYRLRSP